MGDLANDAITGINTAQQMGLIDKNQASGARTAIRLANRTYEYSQRASKWVNQRSGKSIKQHRAKQNRRVPTRLGGTFGGPYQGKLVPSHKFGKPKGKPLKSLDVHKEITGTVSDPDICFIGTGVNYQDLIDKFFLVLIHRLFKHAKVDIVNYDNIVHGTWTIRTTYYASPAAQQESSSSYVAGANSDAKTLATGLRAQWVTDFTSATHKVNSIRLISTVNTVDQEMSQLMVDGLFIGIDIYQALLVQNQTKSGVADESTTQVDTNPVYIASYESNSNIIYSKERDETKQATYKPWAHFNDNYPEIFAYAGAAQFNSAQIPNQNSKIFANAKMKYRALLQPGSMKKMNTTYHFRYRFNKWLKIFREQFAVAGVPDGDLQLLPGGSRILGFDKMLAQDANDVTIAYELNQRIIGGSRYKYKTSTVPLYE